MRNNLGQNLSDDSGRFSMWIGVTFLLVLTEC